MNFKRAGKSIFGVDLNSAEQKALNTEIQKQIAKYDRENAIMIDALVLWELYSQLGLNPEQLEKFYRGFAPDLDRLIKYYELGNEDTNWLCVRQLKEIGVDIEKWHRECEGGA